MLDIRHLTVSISNKTILKDISYLFEKNKTYIVMGPNGSGKSTLAHTIAGHPQYTINKKSQIFFDRKNITDLTPDKRAQMGIFLSFQSP